MAYDETLAERIRKYLTTKTPFEEKKMMGGLTFMVKGKMCVGILKDELMVRIDKEDHASTLRKKGAREMDFTGRVMKGFVLVSKEGIGTSASLSSWLEVALAFNVKAKSYGKKDKKIDAKKIRVKKPKPLLTEKPRKSIHLRVNQIITALQSRIEIG